MSNIQVDLLNNARAVWPRTNNFGMITHVGNSALPNFGIPFIYAYTNLMQNYRIWRGNTYREGLVFRGQSRPTPWGRGHSAPLFLWFLSVYKCVHPLSQNCQIWRGNTCIQGWTFYESLTPPPPTWRGPAIHNFGGFLLFMCTQNYPIAELPSLTW